MRHSFSEKNQRAPQSQRHGVHEKSCTAVKDGLQDTLNLNMSGSDLLNSLGNKSTAGFCWHPNTQSQVCHP